MMASSKAKAKGISATSFFDLKAELSKKEAELVKAKAEGRNLAVVGGVKRPDKVSQLLDLHSLTSILTNRIETNSMDTPK